MAERSKQTTTRGRPDTPTLDKMVEVHETSQTIGEFLDWLMAPREHEGFGVQLLRWDERVDVRPCTKVWPDTREERQTTVDDLRRLDAELRGADPDAVPPLPVPEPRAHPANCRCGGAGYFEVRMEDWVPVGKTIQGLLAEYFHIDLDAAETEREALLDWVREQNS